MSNYKKMVLDWRFKEKTMNQVVKYSSHILDKNFKDHLVNNVSYCYSDNMNFLPNEIYLSKFINSFRQYYTSIKAFHGCRPIELKPYFTDGLLGQNKKKIESIFCKIFSDFDPAVLNECIEKHNGKSLNEEGKIFFVCDDKDLINDSGHYLIQGSEHLQALATLLNRNPGSVYDHKLRLREFGIPTIIEVDIPTRIVPESQIKEFCQLILSKWCNNILGADDNSGYDDMCLTITGDLSPEYITSHYHPKEIIDPHNLHATYFSRLNRCDMCN